MEVLVLLDSQDGITTEGVLQVKDNTSHYLNFLKPKDLRTEKTYMDLDILRFNIFKIGTRYCIVAKDEEELDNILGRY